MSDSWIGDLRTQIWTGEEWRTIELPTNETLKEWITIFFYNNWEGDYIDRDTLRRMITLILNGRTTAIAYSI
jgi:hypothetical protein